MTTQPNALLDLAPGIGVRYESVRWDLLTVGGARVGELNVERGASMTVSGDGSIKRTVNGVRVPADQWADVDPYRNRLQPVWRLSDGTEWPLGVLFFTGAPTGVDDPEQLVELTSLYDGGLLLDQPITQTFGISQGGSVESAITEIVDRLQIAGIRILNVEQDSTDVRAREPVAWPIGTPTAQVLASLCELAGFYPPHFDNRGTLRLRPARAPEVSQADHFYTQRGGRVAAGSYRRNDNLLDAPNMHVVIATGAAETEITATAEVDYQLPWSRQNRGYAVVEVHRLQGIETTTQAQRMADRFAAASANDAQEIEFTTTPDPRHDIFDVVDFDGVRYLEVGWALPLEPGGAHTHRINRGGYQNA